MKWSSRKFMPECFITLTWGIEKAFYKKFTIVIAAGGLVLNEKKNINDIPQGKMGSAKRKVR